MNGNRAATPLAQLFERGTLTGLDDVQLLERYARRGDREAFEALTARHGPMVMGVCRRILMEPSDVEDAFQATFLVLIRRAGSLGPGDVPAAWLHGVATKVARRARMDRARRRSRERDGLAVEPRHEPAAADFALRGVIDEEVERLPWKYRAPIALCYLEGLTHEEAAARLGWPVGSVKGRLARARAILGPRLRRRGVATGAAALALENLATAAVPEALTAAVALSAARVAAGVAWSSVLSCPVVKLAKGACGTMTVVKSTAAVLTGAVLIAAAGMGIVAAQTAGKGPSGPITSILETSRAADAPVDANPKTAEILKRLDEPLTMNFPNDTPLEDVLKYIVGETAKTSEGGGIPIYVEPVGLIEAEKTVNSPVSIELDGVPLRRTLQIVLKQLGLVYYVEDGVLVVTSPESAAMGGLGPDMAPPFALRREIEKATTRGESTVEEMETLVRKLKLINEIKEAVRDPKRTGRGGGFQ